MIPRVPPILDTVCCSWTKFISLIPLSFDCIFLHGKRICMFDRHANLLLVLLLQKLEILKLKNLVAILTTKCTVFYYRFRVNYKYTLIMKFCKNFPTHLLWDLGYENLNFDITIIELIWYVNFHWNIGSILFFWKSNLWSAKTFTKTSFDIFAYCLTSKNGCSKKWHVLNFQYGNEQNILP